MNRSLASECQVSRFTMGDSELRNGILRPQHFVASGVHWHPKWKESDKRPLSGTGSVTLG